ncbi:MAG: membrane dipeptidase [Anaerolineaceae bacterium]|jgi:membrane dipeptidase
MPLIIDSHEDLAYNMLNFGRDYRRSASEIRQIEKDSSVPEHNGQALIGWPDYQRAQVAVVFGTLFLAPRRYSSGNWDTQVFADSQEARPKLHAQLDSYRRLCENSPDFFRLIASRRDLEDVLKPWDQAPAAFPHVTRPVGLVLLMEGAEAIGDPGEVEEWWQAGLRIIGPVWAGTRFCGGTLEPGGFTSEGFRLLEKMARAGFPLDISHMNELSALQALDRYTGAVIASHANARALLKNPPGERHFTDAVIRRLFARGGVMGVIPFNTFLVPGWTLADGRQAVPLDMVAAQIDYLCQMAGDSQHAALGTDFDGGFGWPGVPDGIDTIADLPKIVPLLAQRGYNEKDIENIFSGNWRRFLERALPAV